MPDIALKFGRRKPVDKPALKFASFRAETPATPAHPASVDYLDELHGGWQMLGNDQEGDCNAVTWANERRLVTAMLTGKASYPGIDQVLEFYKTQNPQFDPNSTTHGPGSDADGGMSVQVGLEYLHKTGGPDGVKAVAFAKVDPSNTDEVEAALAIFGSLWLGVYVVSGNQDQFAAGQPWTVQRGASIEGGHAILAGGYTPNVRFITWGRECQFGPSFWNGTVQGYRLVEEAWVVIWPEHLGSKQFQAGVNVQALANAYQQLTGKTLDIGAPTPVPAPVEPPPGPAPEPDPNPQPDPVPTPPQPDDTDRQLAAAATRFLRGRNVPVYVRSALTKWIKARGL